MSERRYLIVHWGQSGGGTKHFAELAEALAQQAWIAVSYNPNSDQAQRMAALGRPELRVPTYRTRLGVLLGLPRLGVNCMRFRRFLRRHRITHVISYMESIYQSISVPALIPRDIVYSTFIHDATQHPGEDHPLKSMGRRRELRRANHLLTMSQAVSSALVESGQATADRISTYFHPASGALAPGPRRAPEGAVRIGSFGRLQPYKGIDLFLQAMGLLSSEPRSYRGCIDGSGPEARWQREPIGRFAEWHTRYIPDGEVDSTIASYDILAVTYREASQSGVIASAIAQAVPVVATPVGGLREQVESAGCGILADAITAEAIAAAILRLANDPDLYADCSARGLAAAHSLRWTTLATRLLELP
jgi:glycosyltransferase involved in cell wall biosynthesis